LFVSTQQGLMFDSLSVCNKGCLVACQCATRVNVWLLVSAQQGLVFDSLSVHNKG